MTLTHGSVCVPSQRSDTSEPDPPPPPLTAPTARLVPGGRGPPANSQSLQEAGVQPGQPGAEGHATLIFVFNYECKWDSSQGHFWSLLTLSLCL